MRSPVKSIHQLSVEFGHLAAPLREGALVKVSAAFACLLQDLQLGTKDPVIVAKAVGSSEGTVSAATLFKCPRPALLPSALASPPSAPSNHLHKWMHHIYYSFQPRRSERLSKKRQLPITQRAQILLYHRLGLLDDTKTLEEAM